MDTDNTPVTRDETGPFEAVCEGMFLLMDTAQHNGFTVTRQEVLDHIDGCPQCFLVVCEDLGI